MAVGVAMPEVTGLEATAIGIGDACSGAAVDNWAEGTICLVASASSRSSLFFAASITA